jgi:hypothetical protein
LKLHLPECIQPKQTWLHLLPTSSIHRNFSDPPTDSPLLPGTCFKFLHEGRLPLHLSIPSVISSKSLKSFCHFLSTNSY